MNEIRICHLHALTNDIEHIPLTFIICILALNLSISSK